MSTFGEIVEPGSRTAWEDWDEILPETSFEELKWEKYLKSSDAVETLIILEGKYLCDCVKMQKGNLELINSVSKVHLELYRSKLYNIHICTLGKYDLVLSSEIVELFRQYLVASKNVIAIQTKALPEYQTMEACVQDCIIRAVSTAENISIDLKFPNLEQPNIISGVSAGVITLREHLDKAGTALVCFMEHPEEYQVEEIQKLLEKLNISQSCKSRPSSVFNSNLYI